MRTLGKLTQLVRLYISFRCDVSELTGTANELIETFRANGKTSGSLSIPYITDRWPYTFTLDGTMSNAGVLYYRVIDITEDTVIVEFGNNKNCRIPMKKEAIIEIEKAQ